MSLLRLIGECELFLNTTHCFSCLSDYLQLALIHVFKISSQEIVRTSTEGFKILISLPPEMKLEKESIEVLLSLPTKPICDENITHEIKMFLN